MRRRQTAMTDEVLGAYVDGELDAERGAVVENALQRDRLLSRRVAALRRVTALVRAAMLARSRRRVPDLMHRVAPRAPVRGPRWRDRWVLQTSRPILVSVALGVLMGWGGLGVWRISRETPAPWQQLSLALHERYVEASGLGRPFPLDVRDSDPARVGTLIAAAIGYNPPIPDLSADAYTLSGARVIATAGGPVLYVLYQGSDQALLGFVATQQSARARMALHERAAVRLISWQNDGTQFAFVGTHSAAELKRLAARYGSVGTDAR